MDDNDGQREGKIPRVGNNANRKKNRRRNRHQPRHVQSDTRMTLSRRPSHSRHGHQSPTQPPRLALPAPESAMLQSSALTLYQPQPTGLPLCLPHPMALSLQFSPHLLRQYQSISPSRRHRQATGMLQPQPWLRLPGFPQPPLLALPSPQSTSARSSRNIIRSTHRKSKRERDVNKCIDYLASQMELKTSVQKYTKEREESESSSPMELSSDSEYTPIEFNASSGLHSNEEENQVYTDDENSSQEEKRKSSAAYVYNKGFRSCVQLKGSKLHYSLKQTLTLVPDDAAVPGFEPMGADVHQEATRFHQHQPFMPPQQDMGTDTEQYQPSAEFALKQGSEEDDWLLPESEEEQIPPRQYWHLPQQETFDPDENPEQLQKEKEQPHEMRHGSLSPPFGIDQRPQSLNLWQDQPPFSNEQQFIPSTFGQPPHLIGLGQPLEPFGIQQQSPSQDPWVQSMSFGQQLQSQTGLPQQPLGHQFPSHGHGPLSDQPLPSFLNEQNELPYGTEHQLQSLTHEHQFQPLSHGQRPMPFENVHSPQSPSHGQWQQTMNRMPWRMPYENDPRMQSFPGQERPQLRVGPSGNIPPWNQDQFSSFRLGHQLGQLVNNPNLLQRNAQGQTEHHSYQPQFAAIDLSRVSYGSQ